MIVIVTQCFPPVTGGIENLMAGLAQALTDAGEQVLVLVDGKKTQSKNVPPYHIQRFSGFKPLRWRRKRHVLKRVLTSSKVKAIITDSWKSIHAVPDRAPPILMLAHGSEFPQSPRPSKQKRIEEAVARARVIIANSRYTLKLVEPYVNQGQRCEMILPPIHPQRQSPVEISQAIEQLTRHFEPILLTLCRLEPRKGIDQVIRAMPAVRAAHPKAAYLIAGAGDDRERLEALVRSLHLETCVIFLGRVSDEERAALYAKATLFAMPSRREGNSVEGFGITYAEAGWYGVPSLAGQEGGAADAVIDGVTGVVCDGPNAESVQSGLLRLLADGEVRKRMGEAARKRAQGELQWREAVKRYLQLINECGSGLESGGIRRA